MAFAQFIKQYDASSRAQYIAQYSDGTTIAQADNFDSAIGSATIVDGLTLTPDITIVPIDYAEIGGWLNVYVRIDGVNGKTPAFDIDLIDYAGVDAPPFDWYMVWRYADDVTVPAGGRPRPWSGFDTTAGTSAHTFSNTGAFTSDSIEVAFKPRWRYLDTQRSVAYAEASGYAFELPSSIAASGLPKHVHDQFTHTGTTNNTAPKIGINMYGYGLEDTGVTPDGGLEKFNWIHITGQHACESQGNDSCWEVVQFFINGTGTVADWFRKNCKLFVYDGNPQGRYYGKERGTDETGGDEDANRSWDDTNSEQINAVKAAITADVSRCDLFWDWHGSFQLNGSGYNQEYGAYPHTVNDLLWYNRADTLISPLDIADMGGNVVGTAVEYGNNTLSAQLSIGLEFAPASPGYPNPATTYQAVVEAYVEAVEDMVAASELTLFDPGTWSVTDVDTDESIYDGQTGVVVTITGSVAATGKKVFLEQGGTYVEQTVTGETAQTCTITVGYGALTSGAANLCVRNPV